MCVAAFVVDRVGKQSRRSPIDYTLQARTTRTSGYANNTAPHSQFTLESNREKYIGERGTGKDCGKRAEKGHTWTLNLLVTVRLVM